MGWTIARAGLAGLCLAVVGCDGAPTQKDMMRMALRRPSDNEDDAGPRVKTTKPSVPAAVPSSRTEAKAGNQPAGQTPAPLGSAPAADKAATPPVAGKPDSRAAVPVSPRPGSGPATPPAMSPPAGNLSATDRRHRTLDNLHRIGEALRAYVKANGRYPDPAIRARDGTPLLSWRVALLPLLGQQQLYARFDLDQPWDSPRNRALLAQIPPVYQSPERADEKTNYLVPVGSTTVFRRPRSVHPRRIEDGVANTAILLEVDDSLAVPWTSPREYEVDGKQPTRGLGQLRGDGFFVVFGGAVVRQIAPSVPARQVAAIFTTDGGEPVAFSRVSSPAVADVPSAKRTVTGSAGRTSDPAAGAPVFSSTGPSALTGPGQRTGRGARRTVGRASGPTAATRLPVPDDASQRRATTLLKEVYQARYDRARRPSDKDALAREMLDDAKPIDPASADCYVLLRVALRIAAEAGSTSTAEQALAELSHRYDIEPSRERVAILPKVAEHARESADLQYVVQEAKRLIHAALADDDFDTARQLHQLAVKAARRIKGESGDAELAWLQHDILQRQAQFRRVRQALDRLGDATGDRQTATIAGQYYCFLKGQWDKGLAMLAESDEPHVAELAKADLEGPVSPEAQVRLGDRWWKYADAAGKAQARQIRLRAAYWYRQAAPQLPPGLLKAKVEIRLQEADRESRSPSSSPNVARATRYR